MTKANSAQPDSIPGVDALEDLLSQPTDGVVETMKNLKGDLVVLGIGGKMGPSLAHMVRRADDRAGSRRKVIGVSRFSSGNQKQELSALGIETISCDLLDPEQLKTLPEVPNVIHMATMKFGSSGQEAFAWAMNSYLPGMICNKFKNSRIVAFSTGNVYGLTPVSGSGSVETDLPNPMGDYAMSCLGRERIFEHFSRTLKIPMAFIRLNYATELRYGVLVDLAQQIAAGKTIDLSMGHANVIWQADANAMTLRAFDHLATPPFILNVSGPEMLSLRHVCEELAALMGKNVSFTGTEAPTALLNNGQLGHRLFGCPRVSVQQLIRWTADWVKRGGESHGKPTHFEARDGKF